MFYISIYVYSKSLKGLLALIYTGQSHPCHQLTFGTTGAEDLSNRPSAQECRGEGPSSSKSGCLEDVPAALFGFVFYPTLLPLCKNTPVS